MIRTLAVALAVTAGFALPALAGSSGGRAGGLGTALDHVSPNSPAASTLGAVSSGVPGPGFGHITVSPNTYGQLNRPPQAPVKNNLTGKPF